MNSTDVQQALGVAAADASVYSLDEIRAAGATLVQAIEEHASAISEHTVALEQCRQAMLRTIELERHKLVELFSAEAVDIDDLLVWDLDDETDPDGEMRLVARAMSAEPRDTWTPRRLQERMHQLGQNTDGPHLRYVLKRMRLRGVVESPRWGEYRLRRRDVP